MTPQLPDPSPEELERACKKIQAEWDETRWAQEKRRATGSSEPDAWTPPVVASKGLPQV